MQPGPVQGAGLGLLIDSLCNFKRIPISQLGVYPKYRILNKRRSCISVGAKKAFKFINAWALILRGDTVGTFAEEQWAQWSYLDISLYQLLWVSGLQKGISQY